MLKRVLLVYSDLLLSPGVESLLSVINEFSLKGIAINDKTKLNKEIQLFQPDFVIMDESLSFTDPSFIIEMLTDYPQMHFIVIKIRDNQLHVYNRIQVPVLRVEDLLSVIRD